MITLTHLEQLATVPVPEPLKTFLHDQLITQPFKHWQPLKLGF